MSWNQLKITTYIPPQPTPPPPSPTPTPTDPGTAVLVTGLNPEEFARATYGRPIIMWAASKPRIGSTIMWGPEVRTVAGIRYADYGVSFGIPADPTGSREALELRLDGKKVWTKTDGALITGLTFRFYPGSETQEPDPLETAKYPSAPIAYRGQCLIFFENLALTAYEDRIPHVAVLIGDSTFGAPDDRILAGEGFESLAVNPHIGLDSDEFTTDGLTQQFDGIIFADPGASFIDQLARFARIFPWDVAQKDKLSLLERAADAPDLECTVENVIADQQGSIVRTRTQQADVARELEFKYIDIDRDYEINPARARLPREPVAMTASIGKEQVMLPAVMTAEEAVSWVTLRKYQDELTRDKLAFTLGPYGIETEPGDFVRIDTPSKTWLIRVLETLKGANFTTECIGEPILRCAFVVSADDHFASVVLLLGFEGVDASTTITDESPKLNGNAFINGNAQIDTAVGLYGTSSLLCDGTGDFISYNDVGSGQKRWQLVAVSTDEFTVEASVMFNGAASTQILCGVWNGSGQFGWVLQKSGSEIQFGLSNDGLAGTFVFVTTSGAGITTGVRYRVCADKDSAGVIRVYVDGIKLGSGTPANPVTFWNNFALTIGGTNTGNGLNGWLDELRITKGVARYKNDFGYAPQLTPFPRQ